MLLWSRGGELLSFILALSSFIYILLSMINVFFFSAHFAFLPRGGESVVRQGFLIFAPKVELRIIANCVYGERYCC